LLPREGTHKDCLPEQKEDFLDGEVGSAAAAELGDHAKEQD